MNRKLRILPLVCFLTLLVGCGQSSHQDIYDFIAESKRKPPGKIRSLSVYSPYKPYIYQAMQLRSPFDPPAVVEKKVLVATSNVKPDFDRQKHRLENFEFISLSMVGTIEKDGVLWALIQDPEGSIDPVKIGYYMGRNHGRIVRLSHQAVDVVEVVSNGANGWIERPNAISIKE